MFKTANLTRETTKAAEVLEEPVKVFSMPVTKNLNLQNLSI